MTIAIERPNALNVSVKSETLPFIVRVAKNEHDLEKVLLLRSSAYGRHLPEFGKTLRYADELDSAPGVMILLAESKIDASILGTMRIQSNRYAPLSLQNSVDLPEPLLSSSLAEATRLAVVIGKVGRLVRNALFKSYFLYCKAEKIDYMVIAGRSPLDSLYSSLLFTDVFPDLGFIPLRSINNIPHRIMSFEIATAQTIWLAAKHPLYDFVFGQQHDDIDLTK